LQQHLARIPPDQGRPARPTPNDSNRTEPIVPPLCFQMPITKQPHQSTFFTNSCLLYYPPSSHDQNSRPIMFPFATGRA